MGASNRSHAPARTVGYLTYELGCLIEGVRPVARDPVGAPLAVLSTYAYVDVADPASKRIQRVHFAEKATAKSRNPVPRDAVATSPSRWRGDATLERRAYLRGFERIQSAIRCGEIYQANLTRAIRLPFSGDPLAFYLKLRRRQPVAFGAYLDLGSVQILSNSPECFLRIDGDTVETFPIKGTRARFDDRQRDRAAVADLSHDEKELAEHVMIVDLERNDLGRVCETGTVRVVDHARILSLKTVHHLESRVRGRLRAGVGTAELLRATFPGGSVTGAPKIQAMRTIAEVEPVARGIYTGSIAAFNGSRSAELSIAIRTAVVAGGHVIYGTGGGIVADSDPEREYEETVTKARAFLDSLGENDIVGAEAPP